ncbi:MAG TPA: radical SAM protein [Deltaproteobacteria bacterium]|nr:radical SAM protein [Deltaproteobacteria bacterium]HPR52640.1 radical SAM protein [Deltaproteobacteria bacterium]
MNMLGGLLGFFFATKILRKPLPLLANFKLTYQCNLTCAGCPFHLRSQEEDASMSWVKACDCIDRLKNMGCRIVIFEGGEPLLWRDGNRRFVDLVHYAKKHFVCVGATTNGTLGLDVPTDVLWVSIDGIRDTHNELRSNSYENILNNIRSSTHNKLFIHFTMNRKNWRELGELVRTLSDVEQVKGFTVQLFYPYNQGEDELALSRQERKDALLYVMDLKRRGYPVLNSQWGLNAMIDNTWTCHDFLLANVDPDGRISKGCYVAGRGDVRCADCGFTPVAEASGAYDFVPGALAAGWRIFLS